MNRIMVLGSSGMAGHLLTIMLKREGFIVANYARDRVFEDTQTLDLDTVDTDILRFQPDVIINCVGRLVKPSEDSPELAYKVNGGFIKTILHGISKQKKHAKLIHLSSESVFSGYKDSFYTERDEPDPINVYGITKLFGEEYCKASSLVIRTSIIGPELKVKVNPGLFEWFIRSRKVVNGWTNAAWSGVTTYELAKYIIFIINNGCIPTGIKHICNGEEISKFELLSLIAEVYGLDKVIEPYPDFKTNKFLKPLEFYGHIVPSYRDMIIEMKQNYEELKDELPKK